MSLQGMKARIQQAGEAAWHRGDLDALDDAYASDYIGRRPPFPDVVGLAGVKQYVADARLSYTDIQMTYDAWAAEGDLVAYRYHCSMKHTGTSPALRIPPTGRELTLQGCVIVQVKDGKVVEDWEYSDYLGFLQQLGVVPAPG